MIWNFKWISFFLYLWASHFILLLSSCTVLNSFFFRNVPWSSKCRAAMTLVYCHTLYTYFVTLLSCSSHVLFFSCTFHLFYVLLISYIIHVYVVTHIQLLYPFLSLYDTILLFYLWKQSFTSLPFNVHSFISYLLIHYAYVFMSCMYGGQVYM